MGQKRILSGMRPTGKLHLGHYTGALENWVARQDELDTGGKRVFETYFLIADYHSLTTSLETADIFDCTIDMVTDWLAAGVDPEKSPIFRQSRVKQHTELFLIYAMLITASRLERNPTLKDQVRDLNMEAISYGHLGYPVLQAADILLYKGNIVPVGEDQLPHVEITREIARRFNKQYQHPELGDVFEEPEPKITKFSRLAGLDGKMKMSKSLGNTIFLSDSPEEVQKKLRKAVTDTQKIRKNDPGRPEVCTVFSYHCKFSDPQRVEQIERDCRSGALGCVDCKKLCATAISEELAPILEKRSEYVTQPDMVKEILLTGENRARMVAEETMSQVREAMKIG
ncbi:tryptophan--tRNA ligase [Prosthecochloris sp. SCSIO W1102]|uniref:tryptophan--tRNA ligase n=1 Tax=Prosthecochloris sp. SCSIO W1102 TaxID=2992243 RepID=UPI00223E2386|nr:tryptophan--tRNA ligase [Prosthecochloris sp. SCSIO W1102]UZJ39396.1 tryptophan--tRNA ligase [Prosthecochloris sp. SCSIO W1102]